MLVATLPTIAADEPSMTQARITAATRALGRSGLGVKVGVLDTPIALDHPGVSVLRPALLHPNADWVLSEHGTHVAGTIAGRNGYGAAPGAQIYDISVLDPFGDWAGDLTLRSAFSVAARYGVSIVNMSFGYSGGYTLDYDEFSAIANKRRSILAVKAAGNDGVNLVSVKTPSIASTYLDNLMLVGSVDRINRISSFSNRPGEGCFATYRSGSWSCREQDKYKYFFIVAPGENIVSTVPGGGYAAMSGTSMATPHVAGAAALLQGRWSFLKTRPQATANILFRSATDLGAAGVDAVYGWGLLNVERAFQPVGQAQLYSTTKAYPSGTVSRISPTGPLYQMLGWNTTLSTLSVFDDYERDFRVSSRAFTEKARSGLGQRMGDYFASFGTTIVTAGREMQLSSDYVARFQAAAGVEDSAALNPIGTLAQSDFDQHVLEGDRTAAWSFQATNLKTGSGAFAGHRAGSEAMGFTTLGAMRPEGLGAGGSLENPILGLASSGTYGGAIVSPVKGVSFVAGFAEADARDYFGSRYGAGAAMTGLSFSPADNLKLGLAATQLSERDGLFGATGAGALSLGERFSTSAVTLSAAWKLAHDWEVAGALTMARTAQHGAGTDLLTLDGTVLSNAATLGVSKSNLLAGGDRLTLTAALPLTVVRGSALSQLASHLDENGNLVSERFTHDMSKTGPRQLDLTLGYAALVLDGAEVSVAGFATLNDQATQSHEFGGLAAFRMKY